MQLLVAALPLIGVVYPAVRAVPAVFDWAMRRRIFRIYGELRALESRLNIEDVDLDRAQLLKDLGRLEKSVQRLNMPLTFSHLVYNLRTHINVVRSRLTEGASTSNPLHEA